jgi:hypothetical protein
VRVAAEVDLAPWEILRFDEYYVNDKGTKRRFSQIGPRTLAFRTKSFELRIGPRTGLIEHLSLPGAAKSLVGAKAFQPVFWADLDHSWTSGSPQAATRRPGLAASPWDRTPAERFRLATNAEMAALSPLSLARSTSSSKARCALSSRRPLSAVLAPSFVNT